MTTTEPLYAGVDLAAVGSVVERHYSEAIGVWLYGSFAQGRARPGSDLDIAVLGSSRLPSRWDDVDRVAAVGRELGCEVDLVDLRTVSPVLRFEVVTRGRRVAARDPFACDLFETTSLSMFQRLNEGQREILDAIKQRGTVR